MSQQTESEYAKALDELAGMHAAGQMGDAEYELKRSRLTAEAAKRKRGNALLWPAIGLAQILHGRFVDHGFGAGCRG